MPDRLYMKGTRKLRGEFEYALQKGKGWFSIQREANAKLRVDDNWVGTEPILQLLECLEAVLFQPSLIKVGEPAVGEWGLCFYGLVDDNAKEIAYLTVKPVTLREDSLVSTWFTPLTMAIDRQSGRLVGLSFLSGGSGQKKLMEFGPPPDAFVMRVEEEVVVAGMQLPKTIQVPPTPFQLLRSKVYLTNWKLGGVDEELFEKPKPEVPP